MTWTQAYPSSANWNTQEAYDLYDFLLMEDGYKLLQQNQYGILLEYSWGPVETTGTWNEQSPDSGGFVVNNPSTASWIRVVPS